MKIAGRKIKVLVVDDSAVARELLVRILASDPEIHVAAVAPDGEQALARLAEVKPDVVTMDIHMPGLDGFEVTRRIMETSPVPIVVVSASFDSADAEKAFRAMEAGAVAAVEKPPGPRDAAHASAARKLVQTVKAMSEVRVVKRWPRARQVPIEESSLVRFAGIKRPSIEVELVAIGASTGGPPVLRQILAALAKPFPVPILVVQHISAGFIKGLAEWLMKTTSMPVEIARDGQHTVPGTVYLAPDGCQMRIAAGRRLCCSPDPPENALRPAVSCLFRSAAEICGERAIGILLTGMGRDGADELRLMRDRGAITIAQDKETSVVFGMPGEAVKLGAAVHVLPAERIGATLQRLVCGEEPSARQPSGLNKA